MALWYVLILIASAALPMPFPRGSHALAAVLLIAGPLLTAGSAWAALHAWQTPDAVQGTTTGSRARLALLTAGGATIVVGVAMMLAGVRILVSAYSRCVCKRTPRPAHRRDLVGSRSRFVGANGKWPAAIRAFVNCTGSCPSCGMIATPAKEER